MRRLLGLSLVVAAIVAGAAPVQIYTNCSSNRCERHTCQRHDLPPFDCVEAGPVQVWATCGAPKASSCARAVARPFGTGCGDGDLVHQGYVCGVCNPAATPTGRPWAVACHIGESTAVLHTNCDRTCSNCQSSSPLTVADCVSRAPLGPTLTLLEVVPCQSASYLVGPRCRDATTATVVPVADDSQCLMPEHVRVECPAPPPLPSPPAGQVPSEDFAATFKPASAYNLTTLVRQLRAFFAGDAGGGVGVDVTQRSSPLVRNGTALVLLRWAASTPAAVRNELYHTPETTLLAQFSIDSLSSGDHSSTPAPLQPSGRVSKGKGWVAALVILLLCFVAALALVLWRYLCPQEKTELAARDSREGDFESTRSYHSNLDSGMVSRSTTNERAPLVQ